MPDQVNWVLLVVGWAFALAIGIGGTAAGHPVIWAPAGLLAVLLAGHALYDLLAARANARGRRGRAGASAVPAAQLDQPGTPVGDTAEVHDEIEAVDLPRGAQARRELERHPERGRSEAHRELERRATERRGG